MTVSLILVKNFVKNRYFSFKKKMQLTISYSAYWFLRLELLKILILIIWQQVLCKLIWHWNLEIWFWKGKVPHTKFVRINSLATKRCCCNLKISNFQNNIYISGAFPVSEIALRWMLQDLTVWWLGLGVISQHCYRYCNRLVPSGNKSLPEPLLTQITRPHSAVTVTWVS